MDDYKVKQIWPNHADHISCYKEKYLNEIFEFDSVVAQKKYDGERMLLHFDDGNFYCTSRRISKKTGHFNEMQEQLPIFEEYAKLLKKHNVGYTVLDGEMYAKDWSTIVGILHSLPDRAKSLLENTKVNYAAFDCLFLNGHDLRNECYATRYTLLTELLQSFQVELLKKHISIIHLVENRGVHSLEETYQFRDIIISQGFEGIVIKPFAKSYYDKAASLKCKKFETLDVIVYDYQQGRGKYENTIGALKIGYYNPDDNSIVHISQVNCGSDEERNYWKNNWQSLQNTVIEVKCQEITQKSLRHPVYIRRRPDKNYKMCTKNTIFKETD